nr:potassium-transporting ATPase subunit C [uncultured Cohaesibacter sp.]
MQLLLTSLRISVATIVICVAGYTASMWGIAQTLTPTSANGSLITRADGTVIGSRLIAQAFSDSRYFWPRPSASSFQLTGAGGSNLSPTSQHLTERGEELVSRYKATSQTPIPADLVTASGSGLDPHISIQGALYQIPRIAIARGIDKTKLEQAVRMAAFSPSTFVKDNRIVNVLLLNIFLDKLSSEPPLKIPNKKN